MTLAVGFVGWTAALIAVAVALRARRALGRRLAGIARASHELRGGIGAARLGMTLVQPGGGIGVSRLRAVELELDRAILALQEFDGCPPAWAFGDIDVEDLVRDCVESAQTAAAVHGVTLGVHWSAEPTVVIGDRVRLAQATSNLICNAIEHGGGAVEVRGARAGDAVKVEVVDDGPGLAKPVAELIRRKGVHPGRGLGLGIAADIVSGHGGRLSAAPSNRGARVVLELPVAQHLQGRLQAT